jgi:hypothetical protein
MNSRLSRLAAAAALLFVGTQCEAQTSYGFGDQGFVQTPVVRTDYYSSTEGTASNPLAISGCHFGQSPCPPASPTGGPGTIRSVFPQSDYWTQNWPANCSPLASCPTHNWVLIMNNSPTDQGNLGPPDASLPRFAPGGGGVMGFSTLYRDDNFVGDTYWRAHLVLSTYPANPAPGAIPYLGFGTTYNHGNPWPVGLLNNSSAPHILKFDVRLWGSLLPTPSGNQMSTMVSWVAIIANWGTHPKLIQLALFHQSHDPLHPTIPDPYMGAPSPLNSRVQHDWRYTHSSLYPGFEYITLKADDLQAYCGITIPTTLPYRQDVHYSINMQTLFTCMNTHHLFMTGEDLPATPSLPIYTVLWANEASGVNGYLWTDVHNMRMDVTAGAPEEVDEAPAAPSDAAFEYGAQTKMIRAALDDDAAWAAQTAGHL